MKKQFLNLGRILSIKEKKLISGGYIPYAICKADCGGGLSVSCESQGLSCSAMDFVGCISDEEEKHCPAPA